jgi:hypothetical protein
MTTTYSNARLNACSAWADSGALASAEQRPAEDASREDGRRAAADRTLDASHDAGRRGEHRYPDAQQTPSEQGARRERDALKRRLAGRAQ